MEVLGKRNLQIIPPLLLFLFFIVTILPSRFFINYSLFSVSSSVHCNYLNFVDLLYAFILVVSFSFLSFSGRATRDDLFFVPCFFSVVSFFCIASLLFAGDSEYIPDLISKALIIWSSYYLFLLIKVTKTAGFLDLVFFFILFALCFISLFLSSYGDYNNVNRSGTSGFGINESALFACSLFSYFLFSPKKNVWSFVLSGAGAVVACLSLLLTSSRRGLIILVAVFVVFLIRKSHALFSELNKRRGKSFSLVLFLIILFFLVAFFFSFRTTIYALLLKSATFRRLISSASSGNLFGDDRLQIYDYAISSLSDYCVFGFFGSDKFYANVIMGANVHCHNLFLELDSVFGIPIGSVFSVFFLVVASKSIYVFSRSGPCFANSSHSAILPSIFLLIYFIFDLIGYSLWNPKMLFLVLFSSFLVLGCPSAGSDSRLSGPPSFCRTAVIQSKKEQ